MFVLDSENPRQAVDKAHRNKQTHLDEINIITEKIHCDITFNLEKVRCIFADFDYASRFV